MRATEHWAEVMPRYRSEWERRHGSSGQRWESQEPIYRYVWEKRQDPHFRGRSWSESQAELQRDWDRSHKDMPWDKASRSIRQTWEDWTDDDDTTRAVGVADTDREVRVPVVEEQLKVGKRDVELGEVGLRKTVVEEQQSVPVELRREEVHVEQRDIRDRPLSAAEAEQAFREETIRVPVRGEEAIVQKEAVVTDEVVVFKTQHVEREQVSGTVRKVRVDVDENYRQARPEFQQHFARTNKAKDRTFEQAEPVYRRGFEAGYDERYAGRRFEDIEPQLRHDYEDDITSHRIVRGSDEWAHLRDDIRLGFDRARKLN